MDCSSNGSLHRSSGRWVFERARQDKVQWVPDRCSSFEQWLAKPRMAAGLHFAVQSCHCRPALRSRCLLRIDEPEVWKKHQQAQLLQRVRSSRLPPRHKDQCWWHRCVRLSGHASSSPPGAAYNNYPAAVTLAGVFLAVILFCSEFSNFVTLKRTTRLGVDTARDRLLRIHLDLSFSALPCQGKCASQALPATLEPSSTDCHACVTMSLLSVQP